MTRVDDCRSFLDKAFPLFLKNDVMAVLNVVPNEPRYGNAFVEEVRCSGEVLLIPYRIYYREPEPSVFTDLTPLQQLILKTLYTRHHDGYIRERNVRHVIAYAAKEQWLTPYVMLLVGEYVEEIIQVIHDNSAILNAEFFKTFIRENPKLYRTIQSRVVSYWDCYYRGKNPVLEQYVGFQVLKYLDSLLD